TIAARAAAAGSTSTAVNGRSPAGVPDSARCSCSCWWCSSAGSCWPFPRGRSPRDRRWASGLKSTGTTTDRLISAPAQEIAGRRVLTTSQRRRPIGRRHMPGVQVMPADPVNRRTFIRQMSGSAAAWSLLPATAAAQMSGADTVERPATMERRGPARIRFSVIGLNHGHINSMTSAVIGGGGELVAVYAREPELIAEYTKRFPSVRVARSEEEILEDDSIQAVLSAAIPDERAPLGIRVM